MVLNRRFYPLYAAAFFQGFVLWYAIEKLFMKSIGFSDSMIAVSAIVFSIVMLVLETPSGILADRWSRKGVLILASFALLITSTASGFSQGVLMYIIAGAFWGVFFALYSGTYDSVVYDTLIEETGNSSGFERYYGKVKMFDSTALVTGSILGGIVGEFLGLRASYFLTIPLVLLSMIALLRFREPQLHKSEIKSAIGHHIRQTIKAVIQKGKVFWIVFTMVFLGIGISLMFEFNQLWYIALALPVIFFGPTNALIQSSIGTSGFIAIHIKGRQKKVIGLFVLGMLIYSLTLVFSRTTALTAAAQVLLLTSFMVLSILMSHQIHDTLSSKIRAGASSAISTFSTILFLPTAFLFGSLSETYSIFNASWVVVGATVLASIGLFKVLSYKPQALAVQADDLLRVEEYKK